MLKTASALVSLGLTFFIVGSLGAAAVFYYYSHDLPDYTKLTQYQPAATTRLYANDDRLLAEFAVEKRIYLPLARMPLRVPQAFLAVEDRNFYHHPGIDAAGILRAVFENIQRIGEDKSLVGGSTITQQVVKNFLLTREKSFARKIKEAILAYRITKIYSKDKILELYLNEIYLGLGAYGVVAAAQEYFGKPLEALSLEEIALLAAMPKGPANYDPRQHYPRALERRNHVLGRMLEEGYVTVEEAKQAMDTPIILHERSEKEKTMAHSFTEEVRRILIAHAGYDTVYKGGLYVETTLDPKLQALGDRALRKALIAYDRRHGWRGALMHQDSLALWQDALIAAERDYPVYDGQRLAMVLANKKDFSEIGFRDGTKGKIPFSEMGWARPALSSGDLGPSPQSPKDVVAPGDMILVAAVNEKEKKYSLIQIPEVNGGLVIMESATGRVLAVSGGYDPARDEFNRATQAKRQPGSAFKPFVYLSALEHGFTPSTIVVDEPVELYQGPGLPLWRPKNYGDDFLGPATLRTGLEKSRNVMTVRLAQMLGIQRVAKVAERFGIYADPPANYSMVLGAFETTLLRLTAAYATIANGGYKVTPTFIERIDNRNGHTVFRRDTRPCEGCLAESGQAFSTYAPPALPDDREQILDHRIAYQMVSLLEGVITRGTAVSAAKLGKPLAGKTGTTNESRDAWFMGFSPDLVVGVYIGFDKPRSLGEKETGGRVALPAFMHVMEKAPEKYTSRPFEVPEGILQMRVDRRTGLPPIPGMPATGELIVEAFLDGGTIYVPEDELEGEDIAGEEDMQDAAPGDQESAPAMYEGPAAGYLPSDPSTPPPGLPAYGSQAPLYAPQGQPRGGDSGVTGTGGIY